VRRGEEKNHPWEAEAGEEGGGTDEEGLFVILESVGADLEPSEKESEKRVEKRKKDDFRFHHRKGGGGFGYL